MSFEMVCDIRLHNEHNVARRAHARIHKVRTFNSRQETEKTKWKFRLAFFSLAAQHQQEVR
jgi:hypothetical protein